MARRLSQWVLSLPVIGVLALVLFLASGAASALDQPFASLTGVAHAISDPHNTYTALTDKCAACHRAHTGSGQQLRRGWPEEAVCLACHNATGASSDLETIFYKPYKHNIAAQSGVHIPGESGSVAFANRHVECEDCHNPHNSTAQGASAPNAKGSIKGASGVNVDNGTQPGLPTYTWLSTISNEYELCFKCHSSYTTGYTGTDKGADFNTNNPSYHPVEASGQNAGIDAAAFVSSWDSTSLVYCSDCHGNDQPSPAPQGPHGSTNSPILKKPLTQATYWDSDAQTELGLCFDCHTYSVYHDGSDGSRFGKHRKHVRDKKISCYACHESHGRSDTVHLIRVTAAGPLTDFTHDPTGKSYCSATCHHGGMGGWEDYRHEY